MNYTSYYARLNKVEKVAVPISISPSAPNGVVMKSYKKLAPSWSILSEYKEKHDETLYTERFKKEILGILDANEVANDLTKLADGKPFCLMCYEKPGSFCHRTIVAEWLRNNGIEIKELVV